MTNSFAVVADSTDLLVEAFARAGADDSLITHFLGAPDEATMIARTAGYAMVVVNESRLSAAAMDANPALKQILFLGTGAANFVDLPAAAERGIPVHTIKGYGDRAVAEHTIALLFAVWRDIAAQDASVRSGGWAGAPLGELFGKTIGLVGVGAIGGEVARLAQALGMTVLVWARRPVDITGVEQVDLDTLLARADVVSPHLAYTSETAGFLDAARLRKMKRGAVLINTARAELTDEAEVLAMLHDGHLGGAGLDVYATEPLPADHPLRRAPRAVLTPHTGWQSPEAIARLIGRGVDILLRERAALGL
ncbi:2-hydroxyacid dehydrogenase [Novosphingobium sp. FSW06-99]|uniref:2-hydroxyacid dehydrogenase n=1 Tax=Novosphingobium sp. FSW06-99 TaxID=1739113 RepID=UPI00076D689F|nr:NAD(P)-dependent oxidoreductase [Novosphingobium sp. FSW06-99]KUR80191.1 hydroxyacid dehydrogenase [Novosphingobium sp. FSW06-99]